MRLITQLTGQSRDLYTNIYTTRRAKLHNASSYLIPVAEDTPDEGDDDVAASEGDAKGRAFC